MVKRIQIKLTKTTEEYIKISISEDVDNPMTMYSYIKLGKESWQDRAKHTFNKTSFIEYLKGIQVPNKYIKLVESEGK